MKSRRLFLFFGSFPVPVLAATLHVGPGETFSAIQPAIDAATSGDIIKVAAGLYPENLVIS